MADQPKKRCCGSYEYWEIWDNGVRILHHETEPAYVNVQSGYKAWYRYHKLHREDGPAQISSDGHKSWYWEDQYIDCKTQEEFERLVRLKAFW